MATRSLKKTAKSRKRLLRQAAAKNAEKKAAKKAVEDECIVTETPSELDQLVNLEHLVSLESEMEGPFPGVKLMVIEGKNIYERPEDEGSEDDMITTLYPFKHMAHRCPIEYSVYGGSDDEGSDDEDSLYGGSEDEHLDDKWERIQCLHWSEESQKMLEKNSDDLTEEDRRNLGTAITILNSGSDVWPPRG